VLPGTTVGASVTALGRCLEMLNVTDIAVDGAVFRLSGTFGVAELGADGGPKELMARADEALYRAKAAGRGRVLTA
jgi:PleD family two-component response regulator